MTWVDYGLVAVILISALVGLLRGFARELFGLATWILAFAVAWFGVSWMEQVLMPYVATPSIRKGAAYAALFLGVLMVGGIITALISGGVRKSALASADRTMGAGLGLIRGLVICGLFVLIGAHTKLREDPWWSASTLIPRLQWIADGLATVIPPGWLDALEAEPKIQPDSATPPKPSVKGASDLALSTRVAATPRGRAVFAHRRVTCSSGTPVLLVARSLRCAKTTAAAGAQG